MNDNKEIMVPSPNEFQILETVSRRAAASGLYGGVGNENKIFMVLLAARELNIGPMSALNGGIWNINGKIEISARLMSSMIRKAGHSMTVKECNSTTCTLEGKRADNGDTFSATFTIQEASKAGLTNRDVWKKWTEDMLYARAMSRLARRLFADVIGNAYVEGELRDSELIHVANEAPEEIKEEDVSKKIDEFISQYPHHYPEWIKEFFTILQTAWNKPMGYVLEKYHDHEKFESDFTRWMEKTKSKDNTNNKE
jgi:hypothetical protein